MTPGTKLGPYEILSQIGAGGMGEVYKARDTRLDRIVAIKTSHEHFTGRFQREAQIIATLNHPNICTLYDVGPDYLVMEYIEGKPAKGPMPLDQLLKYADQICDALDFAHRAGIIHRDLKPSNIMISKQGIKLLDFGVARMPGKDATLTAAGSAVGTPLYMAPELWKGEPADTRSDIYALGVVLNQMLTGEEVAHRTLEPAALERVVRTCMKQDPDERWQSAREVKLALEMARQPVAAPTKAKQSWLWPAVALAAMFALTGVGLMHFLEKPYQAPVVQFAVNPPPGGRFAISFDVPHLAVAPDGSRVVFAASGSDGKNQLWVRMMDSTGARPLVGTDGATFPFWSPDSKSIGFFAGLKLRRIDVAGGATVTLADAPVPRGGTWNANGVIVFAPNTLGPLYRVNASGGAAGVLTKLDSESGAAGDRFPWFLPDGTHFIYSQSKPGDAQISIRIGSLDTPQASKILQDADSFAVYSQGRLLFLRDATLTARPFDADKLAFTGEAIPIAEQVRSSGGIAGLGVFSVSSNGWLAYAVAPADLRFTWLDRGGKRLGTLGDPGYFDMMSLSPNGKSVAFTMSSSGNRDIWTYDVDRGLRTRITFDAARDDNAIWSPDGSRIVYGSNRKGVLDIYSKAADGSGAEQLIYSDTLSKYPTSFSPDGKFLAYYAVGDPKTAGDIWVLPDPLGTDGRSKPFIFVRSDFPDALPKFSPDGKWIAYQSNVSGRAEVYLAPFPGSGGRIQVSATGGVQPRWRQDGKELFFIGPGQRMMAAEINTKSGSLAVGRIEALFGGVNAGRGYLYDIAADGRFLAIVPPEGQFQEPLTVVQNWTAVVKK